MKLFRKILTASLLLSVPCMYAAEVPTAVPAATGVEGAAAADAATGAADVPTAPVADAPVTGDAPVAGKTAWLKKQYGFIKTHVRNHPYIAAGAAATAAAGTAAAVYARTEHGKKALENAKKSTLARYEALKKNPTNLAIGAGVVAGLGAAGVGAYALHRNGYLESAKKAVTTKATEAWTNYRALDTWKQAGIAAGGVAAVAATAWLGKMLYDKLTAQAPVKTLPIQAQESFEMYYGQLVDSLTKRSEDFADNAKLVNHINLTLASIEPANAEKLMSDKVFFAALNDREQALVAEMIASAA